MPRKLKDVRKKKAYKSFTDFRGSGLKGGRYRDPGKTQIRQAKKSLKGPKKLKK